MVFGNAKDVAGDAMDAFIAIKGEDAIARLMGIIPGKPSGKVKSANINQNGDKSRSKRNAAAEKKRANIIKAITENGPLNQSEIIKLTGINSDTVGYSLSVLRQRGVIEKVDSTKRYNNKFRLIAAQ
ncbi:MAG: ArsR family transcriptional regulator [Sphingomonadales bacterium]|nr:MAG: ArsR family transcriptional regulator [Sphingomonadales bacterium]